MNSQKTTPQSDDELIFDESAAIKYILDFIPQEDRSTLTEDDIQYILDLIYDYYDTKGLIADDDETAEEADIDEEDMLNYIRHAVEKSARKISDVEIQLILEGEFEYGVSIGIYEQED